VYSRPVVEMMHIKVPKYTNQQQRYVPNVFGNSKP